MNIKPFVHVACAFGVLFLEGVLLVLEAKSSKKTRLYKVLQWLKYACAVGVFTLV
ncbi:hypothetical protein [Listeria booriae]|uniref:Uncharacterized protein n=1 Tax=Listeria booriae TaxID=1552123 RepID=A0A842EZZ8_9LIST|nr:hypothetical protein [Listeria booriae]MBC2242264.1 hypothetical protein [Listeria booriae]